MWPPWGLGKIFEKIYGIGPPTLLGDLEKFAFWDLVVFSIFHGIGPPTLPGDLEKFSKSSWIGVSGRDRRLGRLARWWRATRPSTAVDGARAVFRGANWGWVTSRGLRKIFVILWNRSTSASRGLRKIHILGLSRFFDISWNRSTNAPRGLRKIYVLGLSCFFDISWNRSTNAPRGLRKIHVLGLSFFLTCFRLG